MPEKRKKEIQSEIWIIYVTVRMNKQKSPKLLLQTLGRPLCSKEYRSYPFAHIRNPSISCARRKILSFVVL